MCRARAALEDLDADVTVTSLAKASRLSRSQFIARYRAAFGDTPHQTRIRARLERAQWLLATTDLAVTDICMAVGFSSLGSFSGCSASAAANRRCVIELASRARHDEPPAVISRRIACR